MADDIVIRFISNDGVTPVAKQVSGSIGNVNKTAKEANKEIGGLGASIGKIAAIGGAVAGVTALGKAVYDAGITAVSTANKFDNYRKSFALMTDSKQEGDALYSTLEKLAARTPFTFDDVALGSQRLLAMGFAAEEIPQLMTTIGDTASAMGMGAEGVQRITTALGQMQAKGKITNEEMMQLTESGVPAFQLLAEATGVSTAELMKMAENGILPAAGNLKILTDAMEGEYGGMMASQMNTATAAQSNFQDASDKATAAIGRLIEPTAIRWFNGLADMATGAAEKVAAVTGAFQAVDSWLISWQMRMQGATEAQIAGTNALRGNNYVIKQDSSYAQEAYIGYVTKATSATKQSTAVLNVDTSAKKVAASGTNSLAQSEDKLRNAVNSLRTSFLSIASAQRDVIRTREALEDATNPNTLEGYAIAADRAYYSNELLNNEITRMKNRQKDVRSQLLKGNITQEDRNQLMEEDAKITEELIGKNLDARESVINLQKSQKDLDRARDPSRIQSYADAHTTAKLKLAELNATQIENIATVQDLSSKLNVNVDVIGLLRQASTLANTPVVTLDNSSGNLSATLGAEGGLNEQLASSVRSMTYISTTAPNAATGIDAVNTSLGKLQVNTGDSTALTALGASLNSIVSAGYSLNSMNFSGIISGVSSAAASLTSATVKTWADFSGKLAEVLAYLKEIQGIGSGGNDGGGNDGGGTGTGEQEIRNRIQTAFSDKFLSLDEYNTVQGYASSAGVAYGDVDKYIKEFLSAAGSDYTTFNAPVFGRSLPITGDVGGGGGDSMFSGKSVTIILNYATPPDSSNPLKDVEDYITAQGGLVRV